MKLFVFLVVLNCTINAFTLQINKRAGPEAITVTLPPALPAITFSTVGPVSSIQLTGTANWSFGSAQETGTVALQANANGQITMTLDLPSGNRVETQNAFSESQRQCTWSGADTVVHISPIHQCWVAAPWFLPQITMQTGAGASDDVASIIQTGNSNIIRLHHERHVMDVDNAQTAQFIAHLSAVELDIDAVTGLPVTMAYAAHPDNDGGKDLSVEVHYSSYGNFSGVTVPTRIQKFINHALVLDLHISEVQVQLATAAITPAASSALQ
ncbi:MAG TPA: hypothetical protein VGJ33_12585 [Candidatus Angelobacter sp.]|jgi:hypothetical protein